VLSFCRSKHLGTKKWSLLVTGVVFVIVFDFVVIEKTKLLKTACLLGSRKQNVPINNGSPSAVTAVLKHSILLDNHKSRAGRPSTMTTQSSLNYSRFGHLFGVTFRVTVARYDDKDDS
jgi:hypothetical protein